MNVLDDINRKIFLIGIGGVSMNELAEVLHYRGFRVSGSDMNEGTGTQRMRELGIDVKIGHCAENIDGADVIIKTSAIHEDNPELMRARKLGLPILERSEAWGIIMREYENVLCVSGTHGKTTTTSMCAHIALEARRDPQIMVGASLEVIGGGLRVSNSDLFIAEACEYCNSFLNFCPTIAIILNIEEDHLDFFSGLDDIINSFSKFASLVKKGGCVIANADDNSAMAAAGKATCDVITFGIRNGDVRAENIKYADGKAEFALSKNGESVIKIRLSVCGEHNVYNALAACAAALFLGISPKCIASGISKFTGASRRFEYKGECNGAKVYDDYAHHPSEIRATIAAARRVCKNRLICIFQPHTYTRTNALKNEFAAALGEADIVYVADIFAAREKNTIGISARDVSDLMENAEYISDFKKIAESVRDTARDGDIVITMGAGDIYKVWEELNDE